jgi:hypothetical protein
MVVIFMVCYFKVTCARFQTLIVVNTIFIGLRCHFSWLQCRKPSLGLATKERFARVRAKREAQESHLMFLGVQEKVRE